MSRKLRHGIAGLQFCFIILALLAFFPLLAAPAAVKEEGSPASSIIRVVMDDNYPPYVVRDEDGRLNGILIDQWRLWEKKTGIRVALSAMDWAEAQRRMQAAEFDVIDTIFRNEQREKIYDFSKPYARIDVPIFFRSDISGISGVHDLKGFVVAVKSGDNAVEVLRSHGITDFMEFKSYEAIVSAARDHKVNVFTVDKPPATYFLYKMGIYDQFRETGPLYTGEFHRAVLKGDLPLLKTVESGFALISKSEYDGIERHWKGAPHLSKAQMRHVEIGIAVVMVLLSLLMFWLWMLRRVVAQRTEALQTEIQARIENEALLHESEERYRITIEQTGRIVYDLDVATGQVSRYGAIEQITGYAPEEFETMDFETWVSGIHPDDRAGALPLVTAATREAGPHSIEYRYRSKNGEYVSILDKCYSLADTQGHVYRVLGTMSDITERKRAEGEHEKTRWQMQLILDTMGEGIYGVDTQGMVIFVNPAGARMIGWNQKELLGMYQHAVLHHTRSDGTPYPVEECRIYKAFKDGTSHHVTDEIFWRKDGSSFPVEYLSTPILEAGMLVGAVVVFKDITEQIQAEAEKSHLEHQLRQSQKMEGIGKLAGGIAHDFNNILTVIGGFGDMMLRKMNPDDPLKEMMVQILAASERATNLTRSLLAFSRKQLMNPMEANLNSIVHDMEMFLRRILGEDIHLTTCFNTVSLPVHVDSGQIEQVLMNLATNARDAMPKGGLLSIETDLRVLDVSFGKARGYTAVPGLYAFVTVTDSGNGMDEETLKMIFEPFYTTKEVGKGTGLGLSMVYGIVKQHNGYIDVSSEPGKGTTFTIYLPAMMKGTGAEKDTVDPVSPLGGAETILVAEDDAAIRELMKLILEECGYKVVLAENGQDAVDKFIANQDTIQLVILDMIMPKMSGKEAYNEISRLKSGVRAIFSSGYTADFIQDRGDFDEGVELIMKPVRPMELLRKVREMLDR